MSPFSNEELPPTASGGGLILVAERSLIKQEACFLWLALRDHLDALSASDGMLTAMDVGSGEAWQASE